MADAIVKHQDRIPLDDGEVAAIIRDALKGHKTPSPHNLAKIECEDNCVFLTFDGPAGPERFIVEVTVDAIDCD